MASLLKEAGRLSLEIERGERGGDTTFTAPFPDAGPAVLYLKRV
jgi:hypothetical protein